MCIKNIVISFEDDEKIVVIDGYEVAFYGQEKTFLIKEFEIVKEIQKVVAKFYPIGDER